MNQSSFGKVSPPRGGRHIPAPPPSGVRLREPATGGAQRLRELARRAERLEIDPLAFELFFAAARVESSGRRDAVRSDLVEAARDASAFEARFYRLAARALAA